MPKSKTVALSLLSHTPVQSTQPFQTLDDDTADSSSDTSTPPFAAVNPTQAELDVLTVQVGSLSKQEIILLSTFLARVFQHGDSNVIVLLSADHITWYDDYLKSQAKIATATTNIRNYLSGLNTPAPKLSNSNPPRSASPIFTSTSNHSFLPSTLNVINPPTAPQLQQYRQVEAVLRLYESLELYRGTFFPQDPGTSTCTPQTLHLSTATDLAEAKIRSLSDPKYPNLKSSQILNVLLLQFSNGNMTLSALQPPKDGKPTVSQITTVAALTTCFIYLHSLFGHLIGPTLASYVSQFHFSIVQFLHWYPIVPIPLLVTTIEYRLDQARQIFRLDSNGTVLTDFPHLELQSLFRITIADPSIQSLLAHSQSTLTTSLSESLAKLTSKSVTSTPSGAVKSPGFAATNTNNKRSKIDFTNMPRDFQPPPCFRWAGGIGPCASSPTTPCSKTKSHDWPNGATPTQKDAFKAWAVSQTKALT